MTETLQHKNHLKEFDFLKDPLLFMYEYVKEVGGYSEKQMRKFTESDIKELMHRMREKNSVDLDPCYLFEYKGKVFGYNPCELTTLDEVISFEDLLSQDKMNALAGLMFQEVIYHNGKRGWEDQCGLRVKTIKDFDDDFSSYRTRKLKDLRKVDVDFWDDLPYQIVSASINFTLGLGIAYGASLGIYSNGMLKTIQEALMKMSIMRINGMSSRYHYHLLQKKAVEIYSASQVPSPSFKFLLWKLSIGLEGKNIKLSEILSMADGLKANKKGIESLFDISETIYSNKPFNRTQASLMGTCFQVAKKITTNHG